MHLVIFAGLKYRHSYHAGNAGDVLKHVVLVVILRRLVAKPGALFFLDTHAGRGAYDLVTDTGEPGESAAGVLQLAATSGLPEAVTDYLQLVRTHAGVMPAAQLPRSYPGSGRLAQLVLRPHDRAVLCELVRAEAAALRQSIGRDRRFRIVHGDGYAAMRAELPPAERRGLVLIDPAYESQQGEFRLIEQALHEGHRRWATGVFAIWYPIKRRAPVEGFHARLRASGVRRILCAELSLYPEDSRVGMNGCGMIVVNPPFQLRATLDQVLPALHAPLGGRPGSGYKCSWLVPE
jgi:23S rRNA (adenine2030-N6)-methyltransferase